MPTKLKRLTFTVTKEIEQHLEHAKKNLFYDKSQSAMIRQLVVEGLNSLNKKMKDSNKN